MGIAERLLLALSRDPASVGAEEHRDDELELDESLAGLRRFVPRFDEMVRDRDVLDFGCGSGRQALALAQGGARRVVGVDLDRRAIEQARASAGRLGLDGRTEFRVAYDETLARCFDVVISHNSMEHFGDPGLVLGMMGSALKPGGKLVITFGPPWYAPYGAHMWFFTQVPWVQLWFSEATVMRVRSRYRRDGALRYEDVEKGLNRMSIARFERLIAASGLRVDYLAYRCTKGLNFLGRIPLLRELFTTQVTCILLRPF